MCSSDLNEKSDRSSAPDGGTTKEEEERYHKLVTENEQLKKILEQVSTYGIRSLHFSDVLLALGPV